MDMKLKVLIVYANELHVGSQCLIDVELTALKSQIIRRRYVVS
jgi:hypothetical protein